MLKKFRIKDIAEKLKVSPSAVSLALNDKEGVGPGLRLKIKNLAAKMGYIQNGLRLKSNYIAVLYAYTGGHIFTEIDAGITNVLKEYGYSELRSTFHVDEFIDEEKQNLYFERFIDEKSVAGIILMSLRVSDVQISRLVRNGIPVVSLNNDSSYGLSVNINEEMGGYIAAKSLIESGHRKIGMILPDIWYDTVWNRRKEGYSRALSEYGLVYDPGLIEPENSFVKEGMEKAPMNLLRRHPDLTAVIFASDLQAFTGMKKMQEEGIRIPEDISVIGFDNMIFCSMSNPPLTSVKNKFYDMGRLGAQMLIDRINNNLPDDKVVSLLPELVIRESISRVNRS
ncbi:MAG: LacI family DNA-binding transcriptional regulator [Elusimicrobia bacterium]|nr:LacI family DNA-binding transcriptional regulator [Elusimicrobiota bacterium]